jgi:hypothetical protein
MRVQLAQQAQEILGQSDLVMITERVDGLDHHVGHLVSMTAPDKQSLATAKS